MSDPFLSVAPALWREAWQLLAASTTSDTPPFATAALATTENAQVARPRTVILRDCDPTEGRLTCYSDRRAIKVKHLEEGSEFSYLCWDPKTSIQFSGGGPTRLASQADHERIFAGLAKHSRKAYATEAAPGTPLPNPATGLPDDWKDRTLPETDYALANFGIFVTRLRWAEVVKLDREGNTRLAARRGNGGDWSFHYLVP
ncbi:pyridoxamine 5'-phosphate oxidase-like protein [Neolewinella xylanilytica]|uniref:Pyridoxamine 5'-phosphate oxidase-like protein n=1 Tax=Neolewinella xylanilytica TaxID=1514080 RepID=A0A2S6I091_9BACT|nr:hypothetical protein [Neolewinella xylanilytica]PPK84283.1 pyridoxamine 5'-phosphate oxidase-like protein [Neolewinella xylanilytica]